MHTHLQIVNSTQYKTVALPYQKRPKKSNNKKGPLIYPDIESFLHIYLFKYVYENVRLNVHYKIIIIPCVDKKLDKKYGHAILQSQSKDCHQLPIVKDGLFYLSVRSIYFLSFLRSMYLLQPSINSLET